MLGLSFGSGLALELYRWHRTIPRTLILASAYAGWAGSLPPEVADVWRVKDGKLNEVRGHIYDLYAWDDLWTVSLVADAFRVSLRLPRPIESGETRSWMVVIVPSSPCNTKLGASRERAS